MEANLDQQEADRLEAQSEQKYREEQVRVADESTQQRNLQSARDTQQDVLDRQQRAAEFEEANSPRYRLLELTYKIHADKQLAWQSRVDLYGLDNAGPPPDIGQSQAEALESMRLFGFDLPLSVGWEPRSDEAVVPGAGGPPSPEAPEVPEEATKEVTPDRATVGSGIEKALRGEEGAKRRAIALLRRNERYAEVSDEEALAEVKRLRDLAADPDALNAMSLEALKDLLSLHRTFQGPFSFGEAGNIRAAIKRKQDAALSPQQKADRPLPGKRQF
jgi:hypothetical protein